MKIAVCLFGNTGTNYSGDLTKEIKFYNPKICLENYKKIFFKNYNPDYFLHCWNQEYKKIILEELEPKSFIFEKYNNTLILNSKKYKKGFEYTYKFFKDKKKLAYEYTSSQFRWYSTSEVIKLMLNYSINKKIKYDLVFIMRFDLFFYKPIINLEKYDKKFFYTFNKNIKTSKNEIDDLLFICNVNNLKVVEQLYKNRSFYSVVPTYALKMHLDKYKVKYKFIKNFIRSEDFVILRDIAYKYESNLKKIYIFLKKKILKVIKL
jgi:hypothetical protein